MAWLNTLDADPVLVRVLWVLAAIFTDGIAVIVYFAMAIITPSMPLTPPADDATAQSQADGTETEESADPSAPGVIGESNPSSDGNTEDADSVPGAAPRVVDPAASTGPPQAQPS